MKKKFVISFLAIVLFQLNVNAYCARCVKIESERAAEQAAHPHDAGYFNVPSMSDSNKTTITDKEKIEELKDEKVPISSEETKITT